MLKIQRSANGHVTFKIIGRIETKDVKELRELLALETAGQQPVSFLRLALVGLLKATGTAVFLVRSRFPR